MITRRSFLQVSAATAAVTGLGGRLGRAAAQQAINQEQLLRFSPKGQLTILHMADIHAQLKPLFYREPSLNLGVGDARGRLPHITGSDLLTALSIEERSPNAYMLSSDDYEALAKSYGRVGGMDRLATLVKAIRAERGQDRVLVLDGGDALQGSYTALATNGGDMVSVLEELGVEATTGHWEFTLGASASPRSSAASAARGRRASTFSPATCATPSSRSRYSLPWRLFEKGGVSSCRDRPGLPLHADRQPALDDPELVVRHPRDGGAELGRARAPAGRAGRGAALPQRLRRRPQAGRPRRGHRHHPDRPHP